MRRVLPVLRVLLAIVIVAAVSGQLATYLAYWHRIGIRDVPLRVADFFSAFTYEFNLAAAVVLVAAAVLQWRGAGAGPRWFVLVRLCLLAGLVLTGVVYNLLLRGDPVPAGSQLDWANNAMHVAAPILFLIDWLVAPRMRLRFRAAWLVLVFPVAWLAFTMVRGPLVPDEVQHTPYFYPYAFLDPNGAGGWGGVATIVAILVPFLYLIGVASVALWRLEDRVAGRRHTAGFVH